MSDIEIKTTPFDARFPNTNQSKHCWQVYADYFKCINARGEEFAPCQDFKKAYQSLCPQDWVSKWDEQREEGTLPFKVTV
ncbi:cytochrome c oxidase subunit 6b [Entomortierella parvispora]|uniref:Cytochrome c oxidase subunit n=1 Tax=Entomortierella parvispora TaxID=205924 RepID=A0A9P3LVS4_9FUNG|nr:cytochrome c oxidase subunit 6b [Entomortierella parvispora]